MSTGCFSDIFDARTRYHLYGIQAQAQVQAQAQAQAYCTGLVGGAGEFKISQQDLAMEGVEALVKGNEGQISDAPIFIFLSYYHYFH